MRWVYCALLLVGCTSGSRLIQMGPVNGSDSLKRFEIAAIPNHSDEPPFLNGWPTHLAFAQSEWLAFHHGHSVIATPPPPVSIRKYFDPMQPQLRVFEINKYRAIFHGAERKEFDKRLADLKAAVGGDILRIPEILPAVEAYPAFNANIAAVCGDGWKGIRNVCMYTQDNCLVENGRLFYSLQGLSDDERYWIAGYWPVEAESLNYVSRDLTAGQIDTLSSYTLYHDYLLEKLDYLERAKYRPALDELDDIMSGLKVEIK